jgi:hypothetical protein
MWNLRGSSHVVVSTKEMLPHPFLFVFVFIDMVNISMVAVSMLYLTKPFVDYTLSFRKKK